MAARRSSLLLLAAMIGWAAFGSWALWTDAVLGHAVAFFFFSICSLGLAVQVLGVKRGIPLAFLLLIVIAGASEYLQPRFTSRPAEWEDVVSDLIGVGTATAVVVLAAAIFRGRDRLWPAVGAVCLLALGGSLALAAVGSERIEERFACWGKGIDRITSVSGGPIIAVNEQSVRFGAMGPVLLDDGIITSNSTDFRCSVIRSGSYSVVATVVPATTEVGGPMRIFTSSVSTQFNEVNTHLGQEFDALSVRVRSGGALQWESVPGVFAAEERVTVAMVVGNGQIEVFVDGEHRATFELESDTFAEWNESYPMLIGDEFTRDRTFEGAIESVLVFDRILVEGDAALASSND